jgi:hypothetical protein
MGMRQISALAAMAAAVGLAGNAMALGGPKAGIPWTRDFESAQEQAEVTGRPILLNFYCGT